MQMKFGDGQSEFSRVFNFTILGYSRNSRKLDARENIVFYSISSSMMQIQLSVFSNNNNNNNNIDLYSAVRS